MMTCERCGAKQMFEFLIPDEAWAKISPYGDARGYLCLCCADAIAHAAGLRNVPTKLSFAGKALNAIDPDVVGGAISAMHGAALLRSRA